jgi:DNA polymerase III subunit epsilon
MPLSTLWQRLTGRGVTLAPALAARLAAWQALPEPSLAHAAHATEWVVVDSETTGLSMQKDKLIALGAVVVRRGVIDLTESFECVLRQDAASDAANIIVHGIGGEEQMSGVAPDEALLRWLEFAGKRPLVAFHAEFDAHFLKRACRDVLGMDYRPRWVDLAELVRVPFKLPHTVRGTREGSLDHWLETLGIPVFQRHRAIADALAEAQLFLVLMSKLDAATQLSAERLQGLADFELARLTRQMQGVER